MTQEPLIVLENRRGMRVCIDPLGAAIRAVYVQDRCGEFKNVALCPLRQFPSASDGLYAGATLAPIAGRVANGLLTCGSQRYELTQNDGKHHLHGGYRSMSFVPWKTGPVVRSEAGSSLALFAVAEHERDGYPGNREFTVTYTLDNENRITIRYQIKTDRTTCVSVSNHTYWNLSGDFGRSALFQELEIDADSVYFNDDEHIALSSRSVKDSPFDFRSPSRIESKIAKAPEHPQLQIGRGYNHAYVLNNNPSPIKLRDPLSGRRLSIHTDYPSCVFYSGGFIGSGIELPDHQHTSPSCAVAIEAQELPAGFFDHTLELHPGQTRERFICYAFDCF